MKNYSEDVLIEQPTIGLFELLGWRSTNCFHETFGTNDTLDRKTPSKVVLTPKQIEAQIKFNPSLPAEAIAQAIGELIRDRSILNPANANSEIYSHAGWNKSLSKELRNE